MVKKKHAIIKLFFHVFKGTLDNISNVSFWINFIYRLKTDCLFTNTKNKNSKIPS